MSGWKDIASAPRDGTRILAAGCVNGPSIRIIAWGLGRYRGAKLRYEHDWVDGSSFGLHPTHWMPLPDAPTTPSTEGQGA